MPPDLDLPRQASPPPQKSRIFGILDSLCGLACQLDPQGNIEAVGASWDEFMIRAGQTGLTRESVLRNALGNLLPEGEPRTVFNSALAALADGKQKHHVQLMELGSANKPQAISLNVRPVFEGDTLRGFLVQGLDVTSEYLSRIALLDRERKLREMRAAVDRQNEEMSTLRAQAQNIALEKDALASEISVMQNRAQDFASEKNTLTAEITALQKHAQDIVSSKDALTDEILRAFRSDPNHFSSTFCRLAMEKSNAMFTALAVFQPESQKLRFSAQHNAPEYHQLVVDKGFIELALGEGPAGIAAQKGCATQFDHLLSREDFVTWAPLAEQYGYNCIWAFPLEDEEGLYGVLQIYFAAEEYGLPVEQCANLTNLCHISTPLLRAGDSLHTRSAAAPIAANNTVVPLRVLTTNLAEEFSNLLTGVLGHSSLVAAEIGEGHAALEDVRAIEKAARGAARLTRHLTALCGGVHHGQAPLEITSFLRNFVGRERAHFFPAGPAGLAMTESRCHVSVESPSLEVILDGMADHARTMGAPSSAPAWTLEVDESRLLLTLSYSGLASLPPLWHDENWIVQPRHQIPELLFAREAARAVGGDIIVQEQADHTDLILSLPLAAQPVAS
ncbi:hypothetical protein EHM69_05240 [candidate division KSB1 bacterium]|nr:MAG: hypothetical protein EHM69_05240 [candidate division KSB1 bacterium]